MANQNVGRQLPYSLLLILLFIWLTEAPKARTGASNQDYYAVLKVPRDASEIQIRNSYLQIVKKVHPDKAPPNNITYYTELTQLVNRAYEVLTDPAKKRQYDASLGRFYSPGHVTQANWRRPNPPPQRPRTTLGPKKSMDEQWEECQEKCKQGDCKKNVILLRVSCVCYDIKMVKGRWCDQEVSPGCQRNSDCLNNGRCIKDQQRRRCSCTDFFTGPRCSQPASCFAVNSRGRKVDACRNSGKCRVIKAGRRGEISTCLCPGAFTGRLCEEDMMQRYRNRRCINGREVPFEELFTAPPGWEYLNNKIEACDCYPGWRSALCDRACPKNFYGKDCAFDCVGRFFCRNSKPCDHVSGQCPQGCDPGWRGPFCNNSNQVSVNVTYEMKGEFINNLDEKNTTEYQQERDQQAKFIIEELLYEHFRSRRIRDTSTSGSHLSRPPRAATYARNTLSRMNLASLEKLARSEGFITRNIKFSRGSVKVSFQVDYPRNAAGAGQLQETVADVIRKNAHRYKSTLGEEYQIDQNSIKTRLVTPVFSGYDTSSVSAIITVSGVLVGVIISALFVVGVVTMCKKRTSEKATSAAGQPRSSWHSAVRSTNSQQGNANWSFEPSFLYHSGRYPVIDESRFTQVDAPSSRIFRMESRVTNKGQMTSQA